MSSFPLIQRRRFRTKPPVQPSSIQSTYLALFYSSFFMQRLSIYLYFIAHLDTNSRCFKAFPWQCEYIKKYPPFKSLLRFTESLYASFSRPSCCFTRENLSLSLRHEQNSSICFTQNSTGRDAPWTFLFRFFFLCVLFCFFCFFFVSETGIKKTICLSLRRVRAQRAPLCFALESDRKRVRLSLDQVLDKSDHSV